MKNSKKNAATTKKDYQAALMKKAAKKANATPAVDSENTDNISTTTDTAPVRKLNGKALHDALAYLLSNYPAIETTRKSDFKDVFNMLLKLNVDLSSKKDIATESERILNIFGFTNNRYNEAKEFISKYDIPQLVTFMFNGYQEKHPDFCKIEQSVLLKCKKELDAISQHSCHPNGRHTVCTNASRIDFNNASKLLSGNEEEIKSVFDNIKCSNYTRSFLIDLAPELGHMLQQLNDSTFNQEDNDKPNGGYTPFAGLNPADFPEYIDGKQTVDDSSNDVQDKEAIEGEPADKTISEPVMQKQQPSVEVTPFGQIVTPKVGIQNSASSRQDKSVQSLNRAINAIKQYGDLLRQLDQSGFSIDDVKSFVETEKIGFSIHEMLTNKETFDSIADVVTALNPS